MFVHFIDCCKVLGKKVNSAQTLLCLQMLEVNLMCQEKVVWVLQFIHVHKVSLFGDFPLLLEVVVLMKGFRGISCMPLCKFLCFSCVQCSRLCNSMFRVTWKKWSKQL